MLLSSQHFPANLLSLRIGWEQKQEAGSYFYPEPSALYLRVYVNLLKKKKMGPVKCIHFSLMKYNSDSLDLLLYIFQRKAGLILSNLNLLS